MSSDTSWVDLLSDRLERPILVTGSTPQHSHRSEVVQTLRCQVASLLKDKQRLTQDALKSREVNAVLSSGAQGLRDELDESRRQSEEVCVVLEEQSKLIAELSQFQSDGANELKKCYDTIHSLEESVCEKERALEGVYAHVQELRSEVHRLSTHLQASDLERLTLRNAEMSQSLASTQHTRTLLENQLITIKQRLSEEKERSANFEMSAQQAEVALADKQNEMEKLKVSQVIYKETKAREMATLQATIQTLSQTRQSLEQQHQQDISQVKGQLEATSHELNSVLRQKELIAEQVSDLEEALDSARCQLESRVALGNEMKALLEQRAAQIKHLQRNKLSIAMETDLLNMSRESLGGSEWSVCSSGLSSSKRRFSTAQAEMAHLKHRLSESRAANVRLELTCAELRTEGARLLGSQQALATIRQQLLTQNTSLDKGQRSFKETWEREKDDMKNHILSLRNELHETRQLVSSREIHSVRLVSMETELNFSRQTVSSLESELGHVTLELSHMTLLLDSDCVYLRETVGHVKCQVNSLRSAQVQVLEGLSLTQTVNHKRATQIQEKEESVSQLMAQVDLLRARKKVVDHHISTSGGGQRSLLRLKERLKKEKLQTNFVRLRLGYVLRELRLYKQLVVALEGRERELECGFRSLQQQHLLCVDKLRTAELTTTH